MFNSRIFGLSLRFFNKITFYASKNSNNPREQLLMRIEESTTWKDFIQVFKNHKKEFSSQVFHNNRNRIIDLLSKQKEFVSFKLLNELSQTIVNIKIDSIGEQEIISLLTILRSFQMKGFNEQIFHGFKINLLEKYNSLQSKSQGQTQNIPKMMQNYELFNYFKWYAGCRPISERLFSLVGNIHTNLNIFTKQQNILIMRCFAKKQDLSLPQKKLRSYLLQSTASKIQEITLSEIAQQLTFINQMDDLDFSFHDVRFIKVIVQKLLASRNKFDYELALKLLQPKSQNVFIFGKMYDQICDYIFDNIANDGTATIKSSEVLALLRKLSSKFKFQRLAQTNKAKFYNFLQTYLKQLLIKGEAKQVQNFIGAIMQIITKNFYYYAQDSFLNLITLLSELPSNSSLLFLLQLKKIDISLFMQKLIKVEPKEKLDVQMIELAVLVNWITQKQKYLKFKPHLDNYIPLVNKTIETAFSDQQSFIQAFHHVIYSFPHSEMTFREFHRFYSHYFAKLQNPFEVEQQKTSNLYKIAYSQYVTFAFHQKDMLSFFKTYQTKIKNWVISKVISKHYSQNATRLNILVLCNYHLENLTQHKDKAIVQEIISIASKYNKFLLTGNLYRYSETLVYKIAHQLFEHIEILQELNLEHYFLYTIEKYFNRKYKNYHNQASYRQLLIHALNILPRFKLYQPYYLVREGLRLNLLTKEMVKNIDVAKIGLNFNQKCMLNYLKNPGFVPKVQKINFNFLLVVFHNPNMSDYISKNYTSIIQEVKKHHTDQLFEYLTVFNQPRTPQSREVITVILQTLASRDESIEKSDFVGALQNLLQTNYYFFAACRQVIQKVLRHVEARIPQYSFWTHEKVIKFIISQGGYKPQSYFQKLDAYFSNDENQHNYLNLLNILTQTSYFFKQQHCHYVKTLIKYNLQYCFSLFFVTQTLFPTKQMKQQALSAAVQQLKHKKHSNTLSKLQYDYLKCSYPQQMKDINLPESELFQNAFSLSPQSQTIVFLELLAQAHNTKVELISDWGQKNYIVKIKTWVFFFQHPKRSGASHQHGFTKKALQSYFQQKDKEIKVIQIGVSKTNSLLIYLKKSYPELITQPVYQKLAAELHITSNRQLELNKQSKNSLGKKQYARKTKQHLK